MSQKTAHNRAKHQARKMLTREEIKNHTPIFSSKAWNKRAMTRAKKQESQGKKIKK
jgi:hypothetical protein